MPDYFDRLRSIIESVRSFAREYHGLRVAEVEVRFRESNKRPLRCYVPPSDARPAQEHTAARTLTDTQEAIMAVLRTATRAMKLGAIARAAGKTPTGYFREAMKALTEWGLVRKLADHYYADASRLSAESGQSDPTRTN